MRFLVVPISLQKLFGYGANSDGAHVTRPQKILCKRCMELALKDAQLSPEQIGLCKWSWYGH